MENFWALDPVAAQPNSDSELLKQLGFLPGLKDWLMLRQVHALEHGTVWVLSEDKKPRRDRHNFWEQPDNETLGGLSTERGFYLYGQVDHLDLQRAVRQSLQRLKSGEWQLAIHPRCGTNASVAILLSAGLILGTHLLLPRGPIEQMLGMTVAITTAIQLAPELGISAQKYLTTSIPFNLEVSEIASTKDFWGRSAYFVGVKWKNGQ